MTIASEPETFSVVASTSEMAVDLEAIQRAAFPTLAEDELITAAHYRAHIERFPAGQLAVLTGTGRPVACSTDFRTSIDLDRIEHRYIDAVDHNWLGRHDPEGEWLYGADIGVLPAYRRRGLARLLYRRPPPADPAPESQGPRRGRSAPRLRAVEGPDGGRRLRGAGH